MQFFYTWFFILVYLYFLYRLLIKKSQSHRTIHTQSPTHRIKQPLHISMNIYVPFPPLSHSIFLYNDQSLYCMHYWCINLPRKQTVNAFSALLKWRPNGSRLVNSLHWPSAMAVCRRERMTNCILRSSWDACLQRWLPFVWVASLPG